ncbi:MULTISPECIES: nucleotide exchange factor GrpE [unclassified Rhodococcus (in: high G+C Gram-positive bacteria)]|uniref:nucleotide exchange factor GrpE n=1 Tax=unclassified Rhodococcus (in: high G+C Gram-positive bacteria) TaxID=192944 RepID=UPI0016395736|nr:MULTISPECIES: nucleotide exchange factor GrpE [unclassified Rhodococcus (in: high G+C Gram-positive bacteria)]MBC2640774.1 nucleotide exchange factor GrpE [Rhodococcus sp. 3A]MBC2894480.1 nucleotide exchange factor GrpE [Rhodococcus sp. 4CII]
MKRANDDRPRGQPEQGNGRQPHREPIAITDRRRIDPVTGRVREHTPASSSTHTDHGATSARGPGAGSRQVESDPVAELTADLQRLQAEYANYRRRVDRDRAAAAENAKASAAARFLGILDDLDWAREHGDTAREPMHGLDRKLRAALIGLGVAAFGERGDRFDPTLHEAASHQGHGTDLVVDGVLRRGYTFGERKVLRTALVTVIDREQYETDAADLPLGDEDAGPGDSGTAAQVSDPAPASDASPSHGPAGPDPPGGPR